MSAAVLKVMSTDLDGLRPRFKEGIMNDTYQPIYDAVRSRLHNCDISTAVENVIREANLSFYAERALGVVMAAVGEYERPFVMLRPALSIDGDKWCALYGENLQDGLAGFGASPADAFCAFDAAFYAKLPQKEQSHG